MAYKSLGFSNQQMKYPLNSMFGMVVGEQNSGKSYLFQSNPDAFIINMDLSSTVVPDCKATIWPGIDSEGRPMDVGNKPIVLDWDKILAKKKQLIDLAKANDPRPKCVVLDTITPMTRILKPWVAKELGKQTFAQCHGPAAYDKLYDEILRLAFDLRNHGYGVWFIAHLSKEYIQVNETDTSKTTDLVLDLSKGLLRRLTASVEMVAPVSCEVATKLQPTTHTITTAAGKKIQQPGSKKVTTLTRKIAFQDPTFSGIVRSRTVRPMQDVLLNSSTPWSSFETAFENANNKDLDS